MSNALVRDCAHVGLITEAYARSDYPRLGLMETGSPPFFSEQHQTPRAKNANAYNDRV